MREGLGHSPHVGQVVPHDSVGEGEGGSGAVGQVAHHQTIWEGRERWKERGGVREGER